MLRKDKKNKNGQAIFEFLVFIPFLIIMLQVFFNVGGAINGSINQQKSLRGYYYYTTKWSSYFPNAVDLYKLSGNFSGISFFAMGWSEKISSDNKPLAPCYILDSFFGEPIDSCQKLERKGEGLSQFIRVYTMHGVCGPTFFRSNNDWILRPDSAPGCITQ